MDSFIALYRGANIATAKMIAITSEPELVARVSNDLLTDPYQQFENDDPVLGAMAEGRRQALQLVKAEAAGKQVVGLHLIRSEGQ